MSNAKDGQEPSMEDILSSIRRIIADDQDEPAPAKPAPPAARPVQAAPPVEEGEDELELTDTIEPVAPPPAPKRRVEADPPPVRVAAVKREEKPAMPVTHDEDLLAKNVAQASTSALARLTRAAAPEDRQPAPLVGQGLTVDQLVMELLKPQLKDWLEQHLPSIVERVVEQEVKKLARRAELL